MPQEINYWIEKLMKNINDNYFDGVYKDVWRGFIPDILTQREVDFIETYFDFLK